jgi:CheY-like chemotaxis protein
LTNTGYNISVAFDGEGALGLIKKLKTDLILLDVMMPGLDGFEVCKGL